VFICGKARVNVFKMFEGFEMFIKFLICAIYEICCNAGVNLCSFVSFVVRQWLMCLKCFLSI